jgi:hypothetical protein
MKACGVVTSELAGGEWSASRPYRLTPGERAPDTHWIGGCVDPRTGLDDLEKWKFLPPPGLELRPLSRPARSQSLYRLRYRGSLDWRNMLDSRYERTWNLQSQYFPEFAEETQSRHPLELSDLLTEIRSQGFSDRSWSAKRSTSTFGR